MPHYDYQCEQCGHQEEVFQKISDEPLTECSSCHQKAFKRLISGGNTLLRFKGSGFYLTDYCKKETSPSSSCGCKNTHTCS